jgi:hypothetical protein
LSCKTGQGPELISLGRQGTIKELFSRTKVFEISCESTPLALYDYQSPLTVRKYQRGFPACAQGYSRLPLAVSLFPLRAGAGASVTLDQILNCAQRDILGCR